MLTKERFEAFLQGPEPQMVTQVNDYDVLFLKYQVGVLTHLVTAQTLTPYAELHCNGAHPILVFSPGHSDLFVDLGPISCTHVVHSTILPLLREWYGERDQNSRAHRTSRDELLTQHFIDLLHRHFTDDEFLVRRDALKLSRSFENHAQSRYMETVINGYVPWLNVSASLSSGFLDVSAASFDEFFAAEDKGVFFRDALEHSPDLDMANPDSLVRLPAAFHYACYIATKRGLANSPVFEKLKDISRAIALSAPTARSLQVVYSFDGKEYACNGISAKQFSAYEDMSLFQNRPSFSLTTGDAVYETSHYVTEIYLSDGVVPAKKCPDWDSMKAALFKNIHEPLVPANCLGGKLNPFFAASGTAVKTIMESWESNLPLPISIIKRITYKGKTIYEDA